VKYKPYPKYKDSGVEWLGEIPSHWEVKSLRRVITRLNNGTTAEQLEFEEHLFAVTRIETISDGSINFNRIGYVEPSKDLDNFKMKKGDILFSHINSLEMAGNSAIYDDDRPLYSGMNLLRIRPKSRIDPNWLYNWIISSFAQAYFKSFAKHAINQVSIPISTIKAAPIIVPSSNEQSAIARFLKIKLAQIDALIENKQKLIQLLREKRTALISQAVTKGLDSSVPMKDSGVEWLGEIPSHWELRRLKSLVDFPMQYGANEVPIEYDPDLPRYIRITDVRENGQLREDSICSLEENTAEPYLLEQGDLLFARSGATVGKTFLYDTSWGNAAFAGYLIRGRMNNNCVSSRYVWYFANSKNYWEWIGSNLIQATIQNVSAEKYSNLTIPLPLLNEQLSIIAFLDRETNKLDSIIAKTTESIEKLKEYRSALISAVVTGKVDVRGYIV